MGWLGFELGGGGGGVVGEEGRVEVRGSVVPEKACGVLLHRLGELLVSKLVSEIDLNSSCMMF